MAVYWYRFIGFPSLSFNRKNFLLQPSPVGDFDIQTHLFFNPNENIQNAGVIVYFDDSNFVQTLRAYCGFQHCAGNAVYLDKVEDGQFVGDNYATVINTPDEVYLRLIRRGPNYSGYYSENGSSWINIGTHTINSNISPTSIGIVSGDAEFGASEIPADFDYFILYDNSYKIYLPTIISTRPLPPG